MPGIDDLIATFMGQTNSALNAEPAPWQQELLETVNPQKVRRQNIARALAQASTALATTPGNFLTGLSAAASTGADAYLTARDQAETERARVQQLVQMSQQKDQDRRLELLFDAIGVQRNQISDEQSTERHKAGLERDRAYTDYYNRRGVGGATLSPAQEQTNRRAIRNELRAERRALERQVADGTIPPEEMDQRLEELRIELEDYYGVTADDTPAAPGSPQQPKASPKVPAAPASTKNTGKTPTPAPPDIMQQAKDAIARGADPAAVRQRLIDNGYDASGI